jgi:hypothetical protein
MVKKRQHEESWLGLFRVTEVLRTAVRSAEFYQLILAGRH